MATQRLVAGVSLVSGRRREVSEVAVAVDPLAAGDRVAIRGQLGYRNEAGVSFLGMAWLLEAWSWTRRTGTRIHLSVSIGIIILAIFASVAPYCFPTNFMLLFCAQRIAILDASYSYWQTERIEVDFGGSMAWQSELLQRQITIGGD